jgi:hypothetical protein
MGLGILLVIKFFQKFQMHMSRTVIWILVANDLGVIRNSMRQWACHSLPKKKANISSSLANKLLRIVAGYYKPKTLRS